MYENIVDSVSLPKMINLRSNYFIMKNICKLRHVNLHSYDRYFIAHTLKIKIQMKYSFKFVKNGFMGYLRALLSHFH